jgi:hypothetical protein
VRAPEIVEAGVRTVALEPSETFPDGYFVRYLVSVLYEPETGLYVGRMWSDTHGVAVNLARPGEAEHFEHRTPSWSEALSWWRLIMAPSRYERRAV